jgi:AraC-like DNA-binding protein
MTTLSTDGVAARERLTFWEDALSRVFVELDCRPARGAPPRGRITGHPLGPLAVSDVVASASTVVRSADAIQRSSRDHLYAVVPLMSTALLEQHGRRTPLHPGDVALYDSAHPYALGFPSDFRLIVWEIPRTLLLDRAPALEDAGGRGVSGASGLGAAVASFLMTVAERAPELTPRDELTVAPALIDLLAGALLTAEDPDPSSVERMHVEGARACARRRLGDASLTPEALAADAGLSPRHLRRVFAGVGTTPARFLLVERLGASARELADPARAHRSITEVWIDHGFTGAAHFSRAFRRRYGLSPREYRAAMTQRTS